MRTAWPVELLITLAKLHTVLLYFSYLLDLSEMTWWLSRLDCPKRMTEIDCGKRVCGRNTQLLFRSHLKSVYPSKAVHNEGLYKTNTANGSRLLRQEPAILDKMMWKAGRGNCLKSSKMARKWEIANVWGRRGRRSPCKRSVSPSSLQWQGSACTQSNLRDAFTV